MSPVLETPDSPETLRLRAAEKLAYVGPAIRDGTSQIEAMAVMHQLASSPATASDALALLHELQVHQVELDLQQEELHRSHAELEAALHRQATLVEMAPVGYLTVDAQTVVVEINSAGVRLLGGVREAVLGRPLAESLAARSVSALRDLLSQTAEGLNPEACELVLARGLGDARAVQAIAAQDTTAGRFLLVLIPGLARSARKR